MTICLRPGDRRHSMPNCYSIVWALRERIDIVSSAVLEVSTETKGIHLSQANRITIVFNVISGVKVPSILLHYVGHTQNHTVFLKESHLNQNLSEEQRENVCCVYYKPQMGCNWLLGSFKVMIPSYSTLNRPCKMNTKPDSLNVSFWCISTLIIRL